MNASHKTSELPGIFKSLHDYCHALVLIDAVFVGPISIRDNCKTRSEIIRGKRLDQFTRRGLRSVGVR